jgi:hypothetical protein
MAKKIDEKIDNLYDYISTQNKLQVERGQPVIPLCYAVAFKKNDFNLLPLPIEGYQAPGGRERLIEDMRSLIDGNGWKVKMFMYAAEANVRKKKEEKEKHCLIISARDCYDKTRREILEIIKSEGKIKLVDVETRNGNKWKEGEKPGDKDTLLDTVWKGYRGLKKGKVTLDF